jgi:hypothetical protein
MSIAFRSIDGTGNNLEHVQWGSTDEQLLRVAPAAYADGKSAPGGVGRPSARAVSNAVVAIPADAGEDAGFNDRNLSPFVYAWGQFIDHDMDLTPGASPAEAFNVSVPSGDPWFDPAGTGTQVIPLSRSQFDPSTGTSATNPRQQTSVITAWLDGSMVYGSDAARAEALRTFAGGRLKTSAGGLLPFNTAGLPNANDAHIVPDNQLFLAGDVRANENVELSSMHTLFLREHNRVAGILHAQSPNLNDEQLYQRARRIVGGEIQAITYNEFLPALLGTGAIAAYGGYDPRVNPGIANEFSTAAYRVGHSMLAPDVQFISNSGQDVRDELPLGQAFFQPGVVEENGIDPILKYLASDRAQEIDTHVVDGLRNFLFGPPGAGGMDLASLNIQRGRDHGLADYNTTRAAYRLPRVTSFSQITSDHTLQTQLRSLYGSVDNIDLWVGALAENHVAGASVGPLIRTILADQFRRVRDGDRFWYQRQLSGNDLQIVEDTTLARVVSHNTGIDNLQSNVFVFDVALSGTVSGVSTSARRESDHRRAAATNTTTAMKGWTVRLIDEETGEELQRTTTSSTGHFSFSGLSLGTYKLQVDEPDGWRSLEEPDVVDVSRGMTLNELDFLYARER